MSTLAKIKQKTIFANVSSLHAPLILRNEVHPPPISGNMTKPPPAHPYLEGRAVLCHRLIYS